MLRPLLHRCRHYATCALRLLLFLLNNLYCIPSYTVWMWLLYPLALLAPRLYWRVEGVLFRWLLNMVAMLSFTAGYHVVEMGDRIDHLEADTCLFVVNHQSTADVPMLMNMITAHGRAADNAMWIMDVLFKWTNFGVVSQTHHDFFIEGGKAKRDKSIELLKTALVRDYVGLNRKWIMLFPEGGFLKNRKEVSQRFAEKQGLPRLEHVSLPRVGAARAVLDLLTHADVQLPNGHRPGHEQSVGSCGASVPTHRVRWLVDVTVAYPEEGRPLDLTAVMAGSRPPCDVYFYYRVFSADQVPRGEAELTSWLYQLFFDKETQLGEYYRTGRLPTLSTEQHNGCRPPPPRRLLHDTLAWLLRHLFFIGSTVLQLRVAAAVGRALCSLAAGLAVW